MAPGAPSYRLGCLGATLARGSAVATFPLLPTAPSGSPPFDPGDPLNAFDELVDIVARLRGEGGCPWDRAQTPQTMRPYVLEESYEVLDAIDLGDARLLRKELGDVLFQIVLLAQMHSEAGDFDRSDVLEAINRKMIDRHPHVFANEALDLHGDVDPTEVGLAAWEQRKAKERSADASVLDGVPRALPALLRAHRVSEKAAATGFDWPDVTGVRAKLSEELAELDEAVASGDEEAIGEELGDVFFTLVNLGRHLPVGGETALRQATSKFEARFRRVEALCRERGISPHDASSEELEAMWEEAKGEAR